MGILLAEDIARGRLVRDENFNVLTGFIQTEIEREPAFLGGLFAGSVALGKPNLLSDIDILTVYRDKQEERATACMQRITDVALNLHVPIKHFNLFTMSEAQNGDHTVTKSFRGHLAECAEFEDNIIKAPILQIFSEHPDSLEKNALDYVIRKLQTLRRLRLYANHPEADQWRKLIEQNLGIPFYAVLRLLEVAWQEPNAVKMATKSSIAEALTAYLDQSHAGLNATEKVLQAILTHRNFLLGADLPAALDGNFDPYNRRLQSIADMGEDVYQSLKQVHRHLTELIHSQEMR